MKTIKCLIALGFIVNFSCHSMHPAVSILQSAGKSFAKEAVACGKIVAGSIGAACLYGIVNDQITARICPAYFNRGFHKMMQEFIPDNWLKKQMLSDSPTRLGLSWGIMATWWMGALLSVPVILASRVGPAPRLSFTDLIKPTGVALAFMGAGAAYAGIKGYRQASKLDNDQRNLLKANYCAYDVDDADMNKFHANAKAHEAAYSYGAMAGFGLTAYAVLQRLHQAFC